MIINNPALDTAIWIAYLADGEYLTSVLAKTESHAKLLVTLNLSFDRPDLFPVLSTWIRDGKQVERIYAD